MNKQVISIIGLVFFFSLNSFGQTEKLKEEFRFISYGKIPTWTGVVSNWSEKNVEIHIYDSQKYRGHAEFVSRGLRTGINFRQFKEQVRNPENRKYLPFFLYDLRNNPIELYNIKHTWAIRLEDYQYKDSPQEISSAISKLMIIMNNYLQKNDYLGNGLVILVGNKKSKVNKKIAPILQNYSVLSFSITELLNHFSANKIEILNEGIAYGYLRYAKSNEQKKYFNLQDIVIYEETPIKVPLVNGIITLKAQTPLSHVNLLAKNRGTLNIYVRDLDLLLNAKNYIDSLVCLKCKNEKIELRLAKKTEAEKHWKKQKSLKIEIPKINSEYSQIVDFEEDYSICKVNLIGAKASNYALIQKEFPKYVKKGHALPFYFYQKHIEKAKVFPLILKLKEKLSTEEKYRILGQIRDKILITPVDYETIIAIQNLMNEKYSAQKIRLRSSTNCEDLPEFNGAGLYVSKGVKPNSRREVIERKLRTVYASLWGEMAFDEREFFGIDHSKAAMAVLINPAFVDEFANGVSLTIPQKKGKIININSQFGENSVTNAKSGQIPEVIVFENFTTEKHKFLKQSNIDAIFYKREETQLLLFQLKKITVLIDNILCKNDKNFGVDIEFKIMKEKDELKLYIKQARLLRQVLPK